MSDLDASLRRALGDNADDYDLDALAGVLRGMDVLTVDEVPGEEFWDLVAEHELPPLPDEDPADLFRSEVEAACSQAPAGVPAVWRRGGVTLEITGASRVNFKLPQPVAKFRVSVTGRTEHAELTGDVVSSWPRLWAEVESLLTDWSAAVARLRAEHEQALARAERARAEVQKAEGAARSTRAALVALLGEDSSVPHTTMSRDEVAEYLNIAPGSVSKQMRRWGVVGEGGGPKGARYPTAEVQSAAARRPGRGYRSDVR
ncbi:hypothetical protein [Streptomyces sp. NPDC048442]|uniref:hypothetical protein n=1 Tax=Streptomyces sp. NPDC048442 TaxID=3154823 RepID=UPI00342A15B4